MTPDLAVARRLALVWGVHALPCEKPTSMTDTVARAIRAARLEGFAQSGEEIVVTAGVPFAEAGTNALRVARTK
jgi:pyruvate kinase